MVRSFEASVGGKTIVIEHGRLAGLAHGAVTVRCGDTIILATAVMSRDPREGIDFFPLTVDFEERMYSAGKIPGGFIRREGRPSETAILTMRMIDRPIRPLFPKGMRNDIQIVITTLSTDQEHQPDVLAIIGASCALTISQIPWAGPAAGCRVGYVDGQFIANPSNSELLHSELDLMVAGTAGGVLMVEAGANGIPESVALDAIRFGHEAMQDVIRVQQQMREEIGKPKYEYVPKPANEEVKNAVTGLAEERLDQILNNADKAAREAEIHDLNKEVIAQLSATHDVKEIQSAFDSLEKKVVRSNILHKRQRPDGRDFTTIRPISCEVGLLPRAHGSGVFTRGQTQVLSVATLGSSGEEQKLDGLGLEETKRYMHHYNFPPYSTGETKRMGSPGRREIGHGALAERALAPVIPPKDEFPYTIRVVSDVVSSNGSTSMGSVCGSTLALMDAGVPIKSPVAGIAMGLVTDETGEYAILTDIQGVEDHLGDMDFKVAGTAEGITALQMDNKVGELTNQILSEALEQARQARMFILERIQEAISEPREDISQYAPRIHRMRIPVDKIGALIGPGGKNIRAIQDECGVDINVEDDGSVFVASANADGIQRAVRMIERLTKDVEINGVYLGKVTRITNFGAFVEILPGKEGLVRLGELAEYQVSRVEDVVSIGDEVMVQVIEIDPQGRINLSRRAVLEGTTSGRPSGGGPSGPPRSGGDRGGFDRGGYDRGPRPSGPPRGPRTGERRPPMDRSDRPDRAPARGGAYGSGSERRPSSYGPPRRDDDPSGPPRRGF